MKKDEFATFKHAQDVTLEGMIAEVPLQIFVFTTIQHHHMGNIMVSEMRDTPIFYHSN